jgi:thioredoxin-related protein
MYFIFGKITILFLFLSYVSLAQQDGYSPVHKFDPARNAAEDLSLAVKEAEKSNRRIILDVGGEWCIWCHRIDEFIESDEEIKNYLNDNYVLLKINYSKENKNEEFLSQYPKIAGYPHFFVLDKNGRLLHSQNTGELEKDKSYNKNAMMTFLKKWAPEKNKK